MEKLSYTHCPDHFSLWEVGTIYTIKSCLTSLSVEVGFFGEACE